MLFTKFIYHKLLGWKTVGEFDPKIKKSVVIVAPHTSNQDFIICSFARRILKTQINFIGKKELFAWPIGWYFRWMGGAPIDRTPGQNKVDAIAQIFKSKEYFQLAIAPEGTRKKVEKWKTGYYYIALKAEVPIISVSLDYPNKTLRIREAFYPTGDVEKDTLDLQSFYRGIVGKKPEWT